MKNFTRLLLRSMTLLLLFGTSVGLSGQSMGNYAFTSSQTGSLEDLTTSSTALITGNSDDGGTVIAAIGFDFYYMGTKYTHFSANSNGQLRLHTSSAATVIGGSSVSSYTASTVTLAPMAGDNEVNDGVKYKVIGTAPNRKFVFEWTQFYGQYFNLTNAGNMQLWLTETTGAISFAYGEIYNSTSTALTRSIFASAGNTANASAYVTVGATPTVNATATAPVTNSFAAGSGTTTGSPLIANLGSAAQGSRWVYTFTPPVGAPVNPTTLAFTAKTAVGMTVNWVDNSTTESGFVVTRATDAGFTQNVVTTNVASTTAAATGGAYTSVVTGLTVATTYYFKIQSVNEGAAPNAGLTGSEATFGPRTFTSVATGNWSAGATWDLGSAPTSVDNAVVAAHTVTLDGAATSITNLTVNSGGTLAHATAATSMTVIGNLAVAGTYNVFFAPTTGKTLNVAGNITNTGTLDLSKTGSLLVLNGTTAQTVGGGTVTGSLIASVTYNNTAANPLITWNWAGITVVTTMIITSGNINIGANELTLGNSAVGTLTYNSTPKGGFITAAGGKFSRWILTTFTGSVANTTYTGLFPFVSTATGDVRLYYISKLSGTISTAGKLSMNYSDASGTTVVTPITDGSVSIDRRTNANWTATGGGVNLGSGVFTVKIRASNFGEMTDFTKLSPILASTAATGTYTASIVTSGVAEVNRASVTAAGLLATFYIGSTNANTLNPPLVSVATGNWSAGATWNTGVAPTASDNVIIAAGHNVTLDVNGAAKSMIVSGGATLTAGANTLDVGTSALCTRTFTVNGTVALSGSATINHFGNVVFNTGSTFTQSGGNFNVDGNAGGVAANSVASGTSLFSVTAAAATNLSLTGGTITIVDPHAVSSSDYAFRVSTSVAINASTAHTLRFGDGVSTDAGTTNGFYVYLFVSSSYLQLGQVIANGGAGVNRFVASTSNVGILGDLTVNANSEYRATTLYVAGNIVNNGLLTNASTINMSSYASAIVAPATTAQSIGGSGVFRNAIPTATITSGGTGYVVGDVITVSGGTFTTAAQFRVTTVAAGVITGLYGINYPIYSVAPTFPASVTGGTGSGATIASLGNILNTTAASMASLTINNSSASGVTLNVPLSISGTFTLTLGLVNTTSANLLTLGTATAGAVFGGFVGSTNMITGPMARTFAASRAIGTYVAFHTGKGSSYLPISIDLSTAATGPVIVTAEAFATNGGTAGAGVSNLSTKTWTATATTGAANVLTANVRVQDVAVTATSKLLHSATIGGTYSGTPGGSIAVAGSTVSTSAAIAVADYLGNFAYGDLVACTAPIDRPSDLVASLTTSTSFTGTLTAGSDVPTGHLVVRYPSGVAATAPVNGTLYATGTNLGGTVVGNITMPTLTFTQASLAAATTYDYYIYSYNNSGCAGPTYYTPAFQKSVTTCAAVTNAPTALIASAITTTDMTISWTASTTPSVEYEIDVSTTSAFTSFVSVYNARNIGSGVTTSVAGLTAGTNYFVRIRAVITGCYSSNSTTLTTATSCDPVTSFTQNFDGVTGGLFPSCWSKVGTTGTATITTGTIGTAPNVLNMSSTSTLFGHVSMPPVSNADLGTYRLNFKARSSSTVGGIIEVGYFNDPNDVTSFTALGSFTTTSTTVVNNFSLPITTPGGITTLIFKHTGVPANAVLIDDVVYELIPAPAITTLSANVCTGPTTLTITGTNLASASAVTIGGVAVAAILTNTATTITATVNAGNSGTVAVTTGGGIANSASTYAVGNLAAATVTPSVTYLCGAGTATLTASSAHSGYTYAWTSLTPSASLSSGTGTTTTVTMTETSDINLVVSDAGVGCSETIGTSVAIYPFPATTMTATPATVCVGTAVALGSGLSSGNFAYATTTFAPRSIPSSAVTLVSNGVGVAVTGGDLDDGGWGAIPIGFNYNYFGTVYSTIAIGTNGTLMFGTVASYGTSGLGQWNFVLTPTSAFPNTGNPGNVIANVARDNDLRTAGSVKYWTEGNAPNRKFIVAYSNVPEYTASGATGTVTTQAILYETSGLVEIHCTNANTTATRINIVGLQNTDKTIGATAVNGTTTTITNAAYRFSPPSNYNTVWSSASTGNGLSGTLSGSNVFTAAATPTTGGTKTYQIVFTNPTTGCSNSTAPATIDVVVDALPTTAAAGIDQSLAASTFTLGANAPSVGAGEWSVVSGDALINALISPTSTISMPVGASTLRWTVTNGSCAASTDEVVITSNYVLGNATTTGSCQAFASVVIDGTNNTSWVPLLDGINIVAAIKANGNNLGTVSGGYFINGTGSMRMSNNNAYLDRNVSISSQNAPSSNVDVRYYISDAEWTALTTAVPAITNTSFNLVRVPGTCNTAFFGSAGTTVTGATSTPVNGYRVIQYATPAFSEFYISGPSAVLPIELKSFTAAAKGQTNVVKWVTTTELNMSEFIIERSANGRNAWTEMARVKATGTTQNEQTYQATDNEPLTLSYYRLRSVETSGKFEVSKVVAVKRNGGKLALLMVSPNPTTEGVTVDFSVGKIGKINVIVTDILGKVVKTETFTTVEGANNRLLNLSNLAQGTYILTLNDGETIATQRIVKQ